MREDYKTSSVEGKLMGGTARDGQESQFDLTNVSKSEDGFWRDNHSVALRVSASDIERHAYCPKSWELAKQGNSGQGEAIESGKTKHAEIHAMVMEFKQKQIAFRRQMIIWTWWFSVTIAIVIDSVAFLTIDDATFSPKDIAGYLALWSLTVLVAAIVAVMIPWRNWFGIDETIAKQKSRIIEEVKIIEPEWEPEGFEGGWFEAGKMEISLLFAAILLGIHSIALRAADDRQQAGFILIIVAMLWTLAASWQLQKALISENESELARKDVGLQEDSQIAYSDDEQTSGLLSDSSTGLRGRPDQIAIIDGEFIPIEQKTGRIPKRPHRSHKMQLLSYIHLVEVNTKRTIPYGVLQYGKQDIHQIHWTEELKQELFDEIKEIQRLTIEGGAKRNHERIGKCENCSRRYACDVSLA